MTKKKEESIALKSGYIYDPVAQKQRKATDEEYVRQEMIKTLVNEYGYHLKNIATEFSIKIGSAPKRVDISIFPDNSEHNQESIYMIIECKKPKVKMTDKQNGVAQLISYISASPKCLFGLWTNGAGFERQVIHKIAPNKVKRVDYDIPRHGDARHLDKAPKIESLVPATTESLKWRFKKCHNIISVSGDDKMTAFWEFLKVIQTKIEDEKIDKEYADFYSIPSETETQDGQTRVLNRINNLYKKLVVPKYGKMGFQGDKINIRPAILSRIVSELQDYSLLSTSPTVKGAAYEEIVGANLRGDKGEFFTPRCVIEAATKMLQIKPNDICIDPACGSGGFSVLMLMEGRKGIENKFKKRKGNFKETIQKEQNDFAQNQIISNDVNRNLANAARMNMLMNHDGSGLIFDQDILEPPQNWTCENWKKLREKINLSSKQIGKHIFHFGEITTLCTNPPFGNDITRTERHVLDQFDLGRERNSQIVEILFIERCVQLLKPGIGQAAIIVPQSILNNPSLSYVREWLLNHTEILAVIELPVETFLISGREGTGTLTAILVVKRRKLNDSAMLLDGQEPIPYPIFMGIADVVGYNRRGKTIFRRSDDGSDIIQNISILDKKTDSITGTTKERVIANDLPTIVEEYLNFRQNVKEGKVFFNKDEGIFYVLE